jgi:hypothetical protein
VRTSREGEALCWQRCWHVARPMKWCWSLWPMALESRKIQKDGENMRCWSGALGPISQPLGALRYPNPEMARWDAQECPLLKRLSSTSSSLAILPLGTLCAR